MALLKVVLAVVQETVCPRVVLAAKRDLATPGTTVSMFVLAEQVLKLHCFHSQGYRCGSADLVDFQLVGTLPARGLAWVARWCFAGGLVLLVTMALEEAVAVVVKLLLALYHSSLSRSLVEEFRVPCRPGTVSKRQSGLRSKWEPARRPCWQERSSNQFRERRMAKSQLAGRKSYNEVMAMW